jgi:hypothetical protein
LIFHNHVQDVAKWTEGQYGSGSFWSNKQQWLQEETSFNLDRVKTPLLLEAAGGGKKEDWEIFTSFDILSGLRKNGVPAEFLWFLMESINWSSRASVSSLWKPR